MQPYPLVLEPILLEKVWGGRRLESLGKELEPGLNFGESWELADLASTSASGAGGAEARSRIANGPMRGLTLAEAIAAQGPNLMGSLVARDEGGGFPLLLKYLDARESLSVQVHPSPAYARAHPGAALKTESWFIVEADPGALIYKGLTRRLSRAEFMARAADGSIVEDLVAVPAIPGDFHHLPSGMCHALGAGVLVAEIQTPSDTTYRVFDWGRQGRALHLEQSYECIDFVPPDPALTRPATDEARQELVTTDAYEVTRLSAQGETSQDIVNDSPAPEGRPMVWMVVRGEGRLRDPGEEFEPVPFRAGTTVLFPAAIGNSTCELTRDATILEIRFPQNS